MVNTNKRIKVMPRHFKILTISVLLPILLISSFIAPADTADSVSATLTFPSFTEAPVTIDDVTVPEGDLAVFTISLGSTSEEDITINYTTAEDVGGINPATTGDDYSPVSGSVTVPAGETEVTVTVPTIDDDEKEDTETFLLNLTDLEGPAYFEDPQGVGTILDDEGLPSIVVDDVVVVEGEPAVFTVELSHSSPETIIVQYSTEDDDAIAGEDYTEVNLGTVEFSPGETSKTVTIETLEDSVDEPDEDFFLNLDNISTPDEAEFADDRGVGTILDGPSEEVVGGGAGEVEETCSPLCPPSLPLLQGQKRDELITDQEGNGNVNEGDTIGYTVTINRADLQMENSSGTDLYPINNITYLDTVDGRLKLLEDSLFTSAGEIRVENRREAEVILVEVSDIEEIDWPIRIEFSGEVNTDLSGDARPLSGQGIIYSDNAPTAMTNDPDTELLTDATITPYNFEEPVIRSGLKEKLNLDKKVRLVGQRAGSVGSIGSVSKEAEMRIGNPGTEVEYTIIVNNKTEKTINGFPLLEPVDAHVRYVESSLEVNGKKKEMLDIPDSSNMMTIQVPRIEAGEEVTVKYHGIIESPTAKNVGHLGTRTILYDQNRGLTFSDDPETRRYGDPTVVLLRSDCDYDRVNRMWEFWARFVSEADPDLLPAIISPEAGMSEDRLAGGAAEDDEKEEITGKSPLRWILYGKREDREILEQVETEDKITAYMPDLYFYGVGRFSLDKGVLSEDSRLMFSPPDEEKMAGGAASLERSPLYIQRSPNWPVYSRVSGSGTSDAVQWGGREDLGDLCLDEVYMPIVFSQERAGQAGLVSESEQERPINLFIVNSDDSPSLDEV